MASEAPIPSSQYLHERLQERRARKSRPKRTRQTDFGPLRGRDDDIFLQEAELSRRAATRMFDSSPAPSASFAASDSRMMDRRRTMGVKDVGEHMDRLAKENFALKLEIDHRRDHAAKLQERMETMEARVARAETLEDEHSELLLINSQLVEELEKRDRAVEEAMDIICDLEDRLTELEDRPSQTRPSTAQADSGYAGTETQELASPLSPPDVAAKAPKALRGARHPPPSAAVANAKLFHAMNSGPTPVRPRREPAVLSRQRPTTNALRSVYLETTQGLHSVQSFNSLLSKRTAAVVDEEASIASPRLSALSESSFSSFYSPLKAGPPGRQVPRGIGEDELEPRCDPPHLRQDSIKRVSRWMEDHGGSGDSPLKSGPLSPSPLPRQPLDDAISSPSPFIHAAPSRPRDDVSTVSAGASRPRFDSASVVLSGKQALPLGGGQIDRPASTTPRGDQAQLLPNGQDGTGGTRTLRRSPTIPNDRRVVEPTPASAKNPHIGSGPRRHRSSIELHHSLPRFPPARNDNAVVTEESDADDMDDDTRSDMVHDWSRKYDGFPDGNSILLGTPSRFLKHARPRNAAPPHHLPHQHRRQSSSDPTLSPDGPANAVGSPTFLGPISAAVDRSISASVAAAAAARAPSPHSSTRTVVAPATSTPLSPTRSLTSRTHRFFRRLSSSAGTRDRDRDAASSAATLADHDPHPPPPALPTLTRTPSSAYITPASSKESRRPASAHRSATAPVAIASSAAPDAPCARTRARAPAPPPFADTRRGKAGGSMNHDHGRGFFRASSGRSVKSASAPSDDAGRTRRGGAAARGEGALAPASGRRGWR